MIHEKKIAPKFFDAIRDGTKKMEFRQEDDCVYLLGDIINLREWNGESYSGREIDVRVIHIVRHDDFQAVPKGWAILSIALIKTPFWKCCECGRIIGDHEWASRGRTDEDHICEDCFWKIMKSDDDPCGTIGPKAIQ